ncbi:hypothetical protein C0995_013721, partial [Termitomyces sp. Mi166
LPVTRPLSAVHASSITPPPISTIEQIKLMHFEKMAIELESTMPIVVPKPVMNPAPTPVSALLSELSLQEQEEVHAEPPSQRSVPRNKGKGKAKAMEDDDNKEEATQKFRKELEDFVVPTTLITAGTRLANVLAGTVITSPKAACGMA